MLVTYMVTLIGRFLKTQTSISALVNEISEQLWNLAPYNFCYFLTLQKKIIHSCYNSLLWTRAISAYSPRHGKAASNSSFWLIFLLCCAMFLYSHIQSSSKDRCFVIWGFLFYQSWRRKYFSTSQKTRWVPVGTHTKWIAN